VQTDSQQGNRQQCTAAETMHMSCVKNKLQHNGCKSDTKHINHFLTCRRMTKIANGSVFCTLACFCTINVLQFNFYPIRCLPYWSIWHICI